MQKYTVRVQGHKEIEADSVQDALAKINHMKVEELTRVELSCEEDFI